MDPSVERKSWQRCMVEFFLYLHVEGHPVWPLAKVERHSGQLISHAKARATTDAVNTTHSAIGESTCNNRCGQHHTRCDWRKGRKGRKGRGHERAQHASTSFSRWSCITKNCTAPIPHLLAQHVFQCPDGILYCCAAITFLDSLAYPSLLELLAANLVHQFVRRFGPIAKGLRRQQHEKQNKNTSVFIPGSQITKDLG